jgi:hypothetical protein
MAEDAQDPKQNKLVERLRPPRVPQDVPPPAPGEEASAAAADEEVPEVDVPLVAQIGGRPSDERVSFVGYVGRTFSHREMSWTVVYRDLDLQTWLIIERAGIVDQDDISASSGEGTPVARDIVWVKADAAVGHGSRALSIEGMFLTGNFTRAGDLEATPDGGTLAASTGVFCGARSPNCCYVTKK